METRKVNKVEARANILDQVIQRPNTVQAAGTELTRFIHFSLPPTPQHNTFKITAFLLVNNHPHFKDSTNNNIEMMTECER